LDLRYNAAEERRSMRAFCPKCEKMVTVYTFLKIEDAIQALSEGQKIRVMHIALDGDHEFIVGKGDKMEA
jgi:hypothetical protein